MFQIFKFFILLQAFLCHCTIYYDIEDWEDDDIKVRQFETEYGMDNDYVVLTRFSNYLVSIRTTKPIKFFGDNHYCVGTIIGLNLVITAAHCLVDSRRIVTRPRRIIVVAGTPNRMQHNRFTVEVGVDKVLPHPEFRRRGPHDIALLVLKKEIPFDNPKIKIATLTKRVPYEDDKCIMLGWGQFLNNGPRAAEALYLQMRVKEDSYCQSIFKSVYEPLTHLCAVETSSLEKGACRGDSGGPLFCSGNLAGIVTYGVGCHVKSGPTVFTDLYSHIEWIQKFKSSQNRKKLSVVLLLLTICFSSCFGLADCCFY